MDVNRKKKDTRAYAFLNFLQTLCRSDILGISDGFKLSDSKIDSGFIICQFGIKVCSKALPLGHEKDCFDGEVFAALQGICAAIVLPSAYISNNIWSLLNQFFSKP